MTVCPFSFLGHSRIYPIGVTVPERWNKGYRHSAREMASSGARDAFPEERRTGKGLYLSGVCCIRCGQCSPFSGSLRNSVPERAFFGTEYACRAQKGFLGYATHFQGHSVRKTGPCGTEGIFGTGNALLRYGVHLQSAGCLASPHVD